MPHSQSFPAWLRPSATRAKEAVAATMALAIGLGGCASIIYPLPHYEAAYTKPGLPSPDPRPDAVTQPDAARVARGRYLVDITGCAGCHTDRALVGEPNPAAALAGSEMGIAYTDPALGGFPGIVYPSNLTPDPATGLGRWSGAQIAAAIRTGTAGTAGTAGAAGADAASGHLAVMSWPLYAHLTDDDVNAIVAYLRAIPPVVHPVPERVPPGTRAHTPYVYFGVYRSGPEIHPPAGLR
jgi:mono/diheme cytochrome c family protein